MSKFQSYEPSELMELLEEGAVKKAKKYINQFFFKTFKGIFFNNTVEDKFELVDEDELNGLYLTPDMKTDSAKNPFVPYIYMFSSEPPIYYTGNFESKDPIMTIKKKDKAIKYINLSYGQFIPEEVEEPEEEEEPRRPKKKTKKRNKKKQKRDNNRNVEKPDDEDDDEEAFREQLQEALKDF